MTRPTSLDCRRGGGEAVLPRPVLRSFDHSLYTWYLFEPSLPVPAGDSFFFLSCRCHDHGQRQNQQCLYQAEMFFGWKSEPWEEHLTSSNLFRMWDTPIAHQPKPGWGRAHRVLLNETVWARAAAMPPATAVPAGYSSGAAGAHAAPRPQQRCGVAATLQ